MSDPNMIRAHVNTAQIESSPFDFKLRLGEVEDTNEKRVLVREVAHISLSPQFAMALVNLLQQTLKKYGEQITKRENIPEVVESKD
jgi:2-phosphoglycerate kinase